MDSRFNKSNLVSFMLVPIIVFTSIVPAFAEDGPKEDNLINITATVPVEQPNKSSSINLLQGISEGKPFHNIIDYIGYKNITSSDMDAVKWSFILSQMATPLEESLEDVLVSEAVTEMKNFNLEISSAPDVTDKDYTYLQIDEQFKVDKYEFEKVHKTLMSNIRYNKVWDRTGNQYTVKTFYDNPRRKSNIGYISDYVYTNKGNTEYAEMVQIEDKIETLYAYDNTSQASNLVSYWKEPERLISDDGTESLVGQRRFIPIFVGSNITDYYLQLGLMSFCKRNTDSGMNYEKFIEIYGNCEIWADSFGNIVFYDSAKDKYRMILPNACNPVFTSNGESKSETLFDDEYIELVGEEELIPNETFDGWSEKTFIYNKWLGSMYSTKRRTRTEIDDPVKYDFASKEDLDKGYYPAYLGPLVDSRMDFRNSTVIVKPIEAYLNPNISSYVNLEDTTWNRIKEIFVSTAVGAQTIPSYEGNSPSVYQNINELKLEIGEYLPMSSVLFNTVLAEGQKATKGSNSELTPEAVYTMYTMARLCSAILIQTANDTVMPTTSSMNLLHKQGGGIAQYVYTDSLIDVEEESLLGSEGGFLEDNKSIILEGGEYKVTSIDPLGNLVVQTFDMEDSDYSAKFLTKRDNRISNRFMNCPSDDIAVISYVWLNDYLPKTVYSTYFEGGDGYEDVKKFLEQNEVSDSHAEEYVLLPFNVGIEDYGKYELTTCTIPLQNADDAGSFYKSSQGASGLKSLSKDGEEINYVKSTPCTNRTTVSPYALLMGLYKNTDTQYNVNNSIRVVEVDKKVDIAELAHKVDYSITNPITIIANQLSGIAQYIHNAIGVKVNTSFTIGIADDRYTELINIYIMFVVTLIILVTLVSLFKFVFKRRTAYGSAVVIIKVMLLMCSVPVIFTVTQNINKELMSGLMESSIDRATLISVEKTVQGLVNTEAKAEKKWQAYRQQFSEVSEVFDDGVIYKPVGYTASGIEYDKTGIDATVKQIKYMGASETQGAFNDNKWYKVPYESTDYPLYSRYSLDVTKYFYDNIMGNYMNYYMDKKSTDQGTVISQYASIPEGSAEEQTKVTDRLDRILHTLKGGYYYMVKDNEYCKDNDIYGIARFMSEKVVDPYGIEEAGETNLKRYMPMLDNSMRTDDRYKPFVNEDKQYVIPYTTEGLSYMTKGERSKFSHDILDSKDWKVKPTIMEEDIVRINDNVDRRVNNILKYRSSEFSDTSLMYMTSIIVVDEIYKVLGDLRYGPPDVTDNDKMLRLIYAENTDDIYNSEALMYIIQDSVKGGSILTVLVVLVEICVMIVNIFSVLACLFVATVMPVMIYRYFDGRNRTYMPQLVGVCSQIIVNLAALYIANIPMVIGVNLANNPIGDLGLWVYTIITLIAECLAVTISFNMLKLLARDTIHAGGLLITESVGNMISKNTGIGSEFTEQGSDNTNISIDNGEISIDNQKELEQCEEELRTEERQGDIPVEYEEVQRENREKEPEKEYEAEKEYNDEIENKTMHDKEEYEEDREEYSQEDEEDIELDFTD